MTNPVDQGKEKKKLEFSKVIVILAIIMWLTVNIFGMVMMAITQNLSPMVYIVGSVDAVMAVVAATYSAKARAENMIKLKSIYGLETAEAILNAETGYKKKYKQYQYADTDDFSDDGPMYEDTSIV